MNLADPPPDVLTVNQAAARLGVDRHLIKRLVDRGVLTSRPNPLDMRQRLIPLAEIEHLQREGIRTR